MLRGSAAALAMLLALHACGDGEERGEPPNDASPEQDAAADAAPDADAPLDASDASAGWPLVSASSLTKLETETHLAVAPDGTVLVAWIGVTPSGQTEIGYSFSPDAGTSWAPPARLPAPDGRLGVDPVPAVDPSGRFHLVFVGLRRDSAGSPYDMRVYAATAAPGSLAFGEPADVSGAVPGDELDKPWATADADGRLFVTWTDVGGKRRRISRSIDGGQTFTSHDVATAEGYLLYPCVDLVTGRVHVVHWENQAIGHATSDDHGETWSATSQVSLSSDAPATFNDPTCVASGGTLWVAYGVGSDTWSSSDLSRSDGIRIARSSDDGQSFEHFWALPPMSGTKRLHPTLARAGDGRLSLSFYQGGELNPDPQGTLKLTESTDDGAGWSPPSTVHSPIAFLTARPIETWLGDYIGLTTLGSTRFGSFADNASGASHVRFFRLP